MAMYIGVDEESPGGGEREPESPRPPGWLEWLIGVVLMAIWLGFVVGGWLGMWD